MPRLQSIHVAKGTRLPMRSVETAEVEAGRGIVGDVPRDPGVRIRVGPVLLEVVRVAAPCKLLDDTIGRGAQQALRRRGGSIFRVIEGGTIHVGDEVVV